MTTFEVTNNTITQKNQLRLNNYITCIKKASKDMYLVCDRNEGVKMMRIETRGLYRILKIGGLKLLKGETFTSILKLSKYEFLCTMLSGFLIIINTANKKPSVYSLKYGGKSV